MIQINAGARLRAEQQVVMAESLKNYVKRLKKLGIKQLGGGKFGAVFQHPGEPNTVVKLLTRSDPGYMAYIKFCQKNKRNKYVPKIKKIVDAADTFDVEGAEDMSELQLVFMEKLEPLHYNAYIDFGEHICKVSKVKERNIEVALMDIDTWKAAAKQTKDLDLAKLAKFIVKTVGPKAHLDMHDENMMARGQQAIITDPFAAAI